MGGVVWLGVKRRLNDGLDLIVFRASRTGLPWRLMLQTGYTRVQEMVTPEEDGWPTGAQFVSDAAVGKPIMRQQTNARSQQDLLRRQWRANPMLELVLLFRSHRKSACWLPHGSNVDAVCVL